MNYQVSRNGQNYGPYTLDDIRRYLASGNILLNDLAKSEEMTDWLPVSQILSNSTPSSIPVPPVESAASYQVPNPVSAPTSLPYATAPISPNANAAIAMAAYPDPPSLHWALVLLFACLTCGLFMVIWNLIVAHWLRRVQPNANAFYFYVGHAVLLLFLFITPGHSHHPFFFGYHGSGFFGGSLAIITWVAKLIARFSEMASLEEHFNGPEPIGLVLNPVMVFFFGGLYFQYHLTRIYAIKQAARFGRAAAPYAY